MSSVLRFLNLIISIALVTTILSSSVVKGDTVKSNSNSIWRPLRIGAGGYLTGLDISADGSTRIVRTDTYGAYIWDEASSQWMQLVTVSSMPSIDIKLDNSAGVYEIRAAPNLPTRLYMAYRGRLYRSNNRGEHWLRTNFTDETMNANDDFRTRGQKMAVDPANPDVVYLGTPQNGLFVTADGGGKWQNVRDVAIGQKDGSGRYPGLSGICFDTSSGVTDGRTNTIYAASDGNGIYESTTGGATWRAIGGPKEVTSAVVSSAGVYYVAGNGNSLWSFHNGTWSKLRIVGDGIQTVAVSPFHPNEIVLQSPGGGIDVSYDGGLTWSGINRAVQLRSTDIPWLASSGLYMSVGGTTFDPMVPDELWVSAGVGIWKTNLPEANLQTTKPTIWTDQSVGIEQLVANQVIAPPAGKPVLASWDRPFFYVNDPAVFPKAYGPINGSLSMGWSLDYASSDPTFIVGVADWWSKEESGYSTDGGRTWLHFASYPLLSGKIGGSIAASTPENIVWSPSNNSVPYYTEDGGVTWKRVSIDGDPANGWGWAYYTNRHILSADRVSPNTFYIYNYLRGLYRSTDGGVTWTLRHPGEIAPWSAVSATLKTVPGHAGHLFFTSGRQGGPGSHPAANPLMRSADGGATWIQIPSAQEVRAFGFGKGLHDYPAIYVVGWVNRAYGIWRSDDNAQSWVKIGEFPLGSLDAVVTIDGDKDVYGTVYVGFSGSGYAYAALRK